jgi:glutamate-1-semialdehyde 2,1-aminomutase
MDELARYRERTPRSRALQERGARVMPLGVESNFRFFEPYPIYIDHASGSRVWDADGNEYIDYALSFGALMVGHSHPAVVRAIERQASRGLMFGMPNPQMLDLAEELTRRHRIDRIRFTNSGTEATMHAMRVARGATGRSKILKFEGGYHGAHDYALVAVKPPAGSSGDHKAPLSVPASKGIPPVVAALTVAATFNDLDSVEGAFARHKGEIAALILEPVMMNIGVCQPEPGFLEALREICTREGALLIFDEVKTGSKLAPGGAAEYYGVRPDLITIAKSFGGGASIGAFGGRADVMAAIERFEVFHAGTYNASPLAVAVSLAALRDVLTPDVYPRVRALNQRLIDGYTRVITDAGLPAHATGVGANGCIYFSPHPVRNYRDFLRVDKEMFWRYFFGMLNRGIIPGGQYYDEQWTISVQHTEADIDAHIHAFAEVARDLRVSVVGS